MKKLMILMPVAALLAGCCCCVPKNCCAPKKCCSRLAQSTIDPVIGNWGAKLPYEEMYAASLIFSRDEEGRAKAFVLLRWASPEWCSDVKVEGNKFSLRHPSGKLLRGTVCGEKMCAEIAPCDKATGTQTGDWQKFSGWRIAPACPFVNTKNATLGEPIDLLKDGLDGWRSMDAKREFGWSFQNGILASKLVGGANLITKRDDFGDFNLEYDVRVQENSNSGVYLRGRFECQVINSYQKPINRHNMAAYYGRVSPIVSAEKAPGEWQHVSITLYKRHLTVVLNGVTVIENAEITGVTGGAIDADVNAKGPLYLQGDHSGAEFKNMILRPAL